MKARRVFVPAAFVAAACLVLVGGCAASDASTPGDAAAVASVAPAGGGAEIQVAQPSGAPDAGVGAKRRAPEAVGTVASVTVGEDNVQVVFTPDAGYENFAGTAFDIPFSAATAIDGETAVVLGDVKPGDRLNVWTGACLDSMPVQCNVDAVTSAA
jgi:hypothetical protein